MTAHGTRAEHSQHSHSPETDVVGFVEPEVIARRAYELFEERGREPGREFDDWLRAEHELKESQHRSQSEGR
jgi:hypothetical protein